MKCDTEDLIFNHVSNKNEYLYNFIRFGFVTFEKVEDAEKVKAKVFCFC